MQRITSVGGGGAGPGSVQRVSRAPTTTQQGTGGQSAAGQAHSAELSSASSERGRQIAEELRAEKQRSGKRKAAEASRPMPTPEPADTRHLLQARKETTDLVRLLANHEPPSEGRQRAAQQAQRVRDLREGQAQDLVERSRKRSSVLQQRAAKAYLETAGLRGELA